MKKIFYLIGATPLLITPTFILSCSKDNYQPNQDPKDVKNISFDDFIKSGELIKKNQRINVKQDEVVLFKQYYSGKIIDHFDSKKDGAGVLRTDKNMNFQGSNGILTMGQKDSLIFLYNKNENDGLSVNNFKETIKFIDTSVMATLSQLLAIIGVKKGPFGETYIPFIGTKDKGSLLPYYGSQNNHSSLTWKEAMKKCEAIYSKKIFKKIKDYYNHATHNFIPVPIPKNTITYQKVGINAIKVTFSNKAPITAGGLVILPKKQVISPISIGGPDEWKSYNKAPYKKNLLGSHENIKVRKI